MILLPNKKSTRVWITCITIIALLTPYPLLLAPNVASASFMPKSNNPTTQKTIFITSGTTFSAPADWPGKADSVECIGGGGGGYASAYSNLASGGGGAYSKALNVTVANGATYAVGALGAGGIISPPSAASDGGDTWFNGANLAASSCGAKGGKGATAGTGGTGGASASGVGSTKYSGGNGVASGSTAAGVGGGGAGGPNGAGKDGGGASSGVGAGGGGGGGNGGGSNGSNNVSNGKGGNGGNNSGGTGHGVGSTVSGVAGGDGTVGGGGGGGAGTGLGTTSNGGAGGPGNEWDATHGSGGGGGGGGGSVGGGYQNGGAGGLYGGGGGSSSNNNTTGGNGGAGAQGIIVIKYSLSKATVGSSASVNLKTGLVGWWTFDGKDTNWGTNKTNDLSGQGNTGTMTSMSTTTSPVAGKIGQGLKFDGVDDYVSVPDINESLTNLSVFTWMKSATSSSAIVYFVDHYYSTTNQRSWALTNSALAWGGAANTSQPAVVISNDGTIDAGHAKAYYVNQNIFDNNWHYIGFTFSANNLNIYVDGVARTLIKQTDDTVNSLFNSTAHVALGAVNIDGTPALFLNGSMDDTRVYSRALSATEIKTLYNTGKATVAHSNTGISSGLVGYWTFDGKDTSWTSATAGTTRDQSGQGNTGTLTSMNQKTTPVAGKIGQGLKFNGNLSSTLTDSYVALASSPTLSTQMSVCAWVNPKSFIGYNGDGVAIVSKDVGSLVAPYTIYGYSINTNGTISATVGDGATKITANSALTVSLYKWVHLCYTYDGNTLRIYKNGVVDVNTASGSYTIGSNAYPPSIGVNRNLFPYIDTFNGSIDDVRVYKRALTAGEIKTLYQTVR